MARTVGIVAATVLVALAAPLALVRSAVPASSRIYLPQVTRAPEPKCPAVRVVDYDGNERDWDWLVDTFGNVWVEAGDGSACLVELRAKRDDSTLNVRVEDAQGQPANGIAVVFTWPDAPPLPPDRPELVGCYDRGVYGYTGQKLLADPGTVGFGMGRGAYYCPPEGGPHAAWVGVEGSDCVHGLGMLCGTNHYHLNATFRLADE